MNSQENAVKLQRLHQVQLELLDELHRICMENDIPYFLDSGSALGAVRHGGFIPWDDDVDIGMLRADYDRFHRIAKGALRQGYTLQTNASDPNVYKFYTKFRKDNTYYPTRISSKYSHQGISIDIFPFDYASDDKDEAQRELKRLRTLYKLIRIGSKESTQNGFVRRMIAGLVRLLGIKRLRERYQALCTKHNAAGSNRIICYVYKMSQTMDLFFDYTEMFPVKPILFEGREYRIMNNPDYYLRIMYGDYMQLPPEEKRMPPDLESVVFDTTQQ